MVKRKKGIVLAVCICCVLFPVTALAAGRASESWNIYASGGGAYANATVTYVKDSFANRAVLGYIVRVLGQDAQYFDSNHKGNVRITNTNGNIINRDFWYLNDISGNMTIARTDYVTVKMTFDGKVVQKRVNLN